MMIDRSILRAVQISLIAALLGAGVASAWGRGAALGWMVGALWNAANVLLLQQLMAQLLSEHPQRKKRLAFLLSIKFGALYPVAIGLLWAELIPVIPFACGFTAVLGIVAASVAWGNSVDPARG